MLLAGKITGAYGIKGWVKVHAYTEPADNFFDFDAWYAEDREGYRPLEFVEGKRHGRGLIGRLAGVEDRTQAERLRGTQVWVEEEQLPALEEGDYYWHQLVGLRVYCEHGGERLLLGVVDHLLDTGANDVLVLRPCEDSVDGRERLIPYLPDDVIRRIDLRGGDMQVSWHPDD